MKNLYDVILHQDEKKTGCSCNLFFGINIVL